MCLYLEKAVHQLIISTCSFYTILIGILWWKSPQACISLYLRDNAICLISPNHISNDLLLMKTHTMMKIPPGLHFFLSASQRHLPNLSQASQWDHLHTKVGTVCSLFFIIVAPAVLLFCPLTMLEVCWKSQTPERQQFFQPYCELSSATWC